MHGSPSSSFFTLSVYPHCRIDHMLGRNLIENLTVLRFSNLVFEPLWKRTYIRNVQVVYLPCDCLYLCIVPETFLFHTLVCSLCLQTMFPGYCIRINCANKKVRHNSSIFIICLHLKVNCFVSTFLATKMALVMIFFLPFFKVL